MLGLLASDTLNDLIGYILLREIGYRLSLSESTDLSDSGRGLKRTRLEGARQSQRSLQGQRMRDETHDEILLCSLTLSIDHITDEVGFSGERSGKTNNVD